MAFSYYRTITIDHTKIGASDLTDYPVLVSGTYADLKTVGNGGHVENASGYDIGFFTDVSLATPLKWEVESYTAASGVVIYWVKVPSVSHVGDTVIYMGYGDASIVTDQSDGPNTWNSAFKIVHHLKGSVSLLDSTTNAKDGTLNGAVSADNSAQIGHGIALSGTGQWYYVTNGLDLLSGDDTHTISMWVKANSFSGIPIIWSAGVPGGSPDCFVEINSTVVYVCYTAGLYAYRQYAVSALGTGWHLFSFGKSAAGDNGELYIDGVLQTSYTGTLENMPTSVNNPMLIGGYGHSIDGAPSLNGSIDEFRVANSVLGASWALADFNSQSNPATFYALGSETAVGGGGGGGGSVFPRAFMTMGIG